MYLSYEFCRSTASEKIIADGKVMIFRRFDSDILYILPVWILHNGQISYISGIAFGDFQKTSIFRTIAWISQKYQLLVK